MLIGTPLLPTGDLPETGVPCVITSGDADRVVAQTGRGVKKIRFSTTAIAKYVSVTGADGAARESIRDVRELRITLGSGPIPASATWVDSPGINDGMGEARLKELPVELARLGDTQRVEQALTEMDGQERDSAEMRNAAAVLRLAKDDPQAATVALVPVLDGSVPLVNASLWVVQAWLLEAIARDALGDAGAARRALEHALHLAGPEDLLFPFLLDPAPGLLDRHRRLTLARVKLCWYLKSSQLGRRMICGQ